MSDNSNLAGNILVFGHCPCHKSRLFAEEYATGFFGKDVGDDNCPAGIVKMYKFFCFLVSVDEPVVEFFQSYLVVNVFLCKVLAFMLRWQRHNCGFVVAEEELFVQAAYQIVAVLAGGVAKGDNHVGDIAVVAYRVLQHLRLMGELGEDGCYGVNLKVWWDVAQHYHPAAVGERCHSNGLEMKTVLLPKIIIYRIRHPCC